MDLRVDVCNGDADGLCAVLQWRLAHPAPATLVTGLKREIELLGRVPLQADEVLVCDIALKRNHAALVKLLDAGARVTYFDHHATGEVPRHPRLEAHLDGDPAVCTSLLVDRHLGGRFRAWALVGAYGDDLVAVADVLAAEAGFDAAQRAQLRSLGQAINYNAYGEDAGDVCIAPARLYRLMAAWPDPLAMWAHEPVVATIAAQRSADLAQAAALAPAFESERARVLVLPDAPWSRRVSGCLANELASAQPGRAQAVLTPRREGGYSVSVRAPRAAPHGAAQFCETFGGSGRAGAAGIDRLAAGDLPAFTRAFSAAPWGQAGAVAC
ncbi:MAG: hypothetical protein KF891_11835 [Rhizobacter sp.]|nr:hypothetical protein [Rhizobacter sp.]